MWGAASGKYKKNCKIWWQWLKEVGNDFTKEIANYCLEINNKKALDIRVKLQEEFKKLNCKPRSKDGNFSNYTEAGPPLGIMSIIKYKETILKFSNSSMYIFTDGITEIKDPSGEMLGAEGFQNYIKKFQDRPSNERLRNIVEDIVKSGKIQKDDLTIVVVDGN